MSNIEDAICHMHRKKKRKQQKATDKKPYSTDEKPNILGFLKKKLYKFRYKQKMIYICNPKIKTLQNNLVE